MPVIIIESPEHFEEIIKGDKDAVVDFWAEWCGPCRVMSPEFEKLSEECASNEVIFAKVNIDDFQSVAEKNNITGIPTFIHFKNGNEAGKVRGANPGALKDLVAKASGK